MPITTSNYTWRQTVDKVVMSLNLHHTSPKKVHVVTTSSYLKVSFVPYMCELFLSHEIEAEKSLGRVVKGYLELNLVKAEPLMWEQLTLTLTKEEMEQRRQQVLKEVEQQENRKDQQRREQCREREKLAVSHQIELDDNVRTERGRKVEKQIVSFFKTNFDEESEEDSAQGQGQPSDSPRDVVNKEQKVEVANVACGRGGGGGGGGVRGRVNSTCSEEGVIVTQEADYDGDGEESMHYSSSENINALGKEEAAERKQRKSNRKVITMREDNKRSSNSNVVGGDIVPPVRRGGSISMTHTTRVFPSPARESTHTQEQKWLEAQHNTASAAQQGSTAATSSQPSQLNDEHFKMKAVTLFGSGDYQGCVNACTEGLRLNPSSPALYSNRAAANLALRNLHHTVKDCSKALELLVPATEENSNSRLLCHIRRGTALVRLCLLCEGLADYQAALQLSPENKRLRKDVERIQGMLMASTDSNEDSGCEAEEDRV